MMCKALAMQVSSPEAATVGVFLWDAFFMCYFGGAAGLWFCLRVW
jgi:hypothetical protein